MTAPSLRRALGHRTFAGLLSGGSIYFVGNAMQAMATAWLMVEISSSAVLPALVQTAMFLPMFLFALPAGVLADTTDRRRLIVAALCVQVVLVLMMALLAGAGWLGAGGLLFFTFVTGCCAALLSPAWNSAIVDAVPREDLPQAITALSISFNGARALGPAAAGVVFANIGAAAVFLCTALGVALFLRSVQRHPPRPHPPTRLPAERLWGGMVSAVRFARHSEAVLAQLVRTVAFGAAGSALWALLPVIGQRQLGLGATGFGLLMACMGGGAVVAGLVIGRLRQRIGMEGVVALSGAVFAAVMLVAAWSRWAWPVYLALLFGGGAWMAVMSTFNTATQSSAPPWVRARANAMHVMAALGAFAGGSALWGLLAEALGLQATLSLAALAMLAGLLLARLFPLRMGELQEVTQASPISQDFFVLHQPEPEAGPVAVEIAYRVRGEAIGEFLQAVAALRAPRRRDGATFWRVYRDLGDPARFVERFIVTSWADYLHQRARATLADQELEAGLRAYLQAGTEPVTQHYIAER